MMILSSIRFPLAFGTVCLVCVALFIFPLSPSSQPGAFSLALDLDESDGDQALSSLDVPADGPVTIQFFGSDTKGANSISVRFGYEAAQLVYEGFVAGDVLPGAHVPVMQDSTSVRIDVAALSGSATMNTGLVGTVRFRASEAFSETEIRLLRAELSRGGRTEVLTPALGVALQLAALPSADFDGSGLVGFADFVLFARAFGHREGEEKYEAKYDLNGDGGIGFDDFVTFARSFGDTVNRAPGTANVPLTNQSWKCLQRFTNPSAMPSAKPHIPISPRHPRSSCYALRRFR